MSRLHRLPRLRATSAAAVAVAVAALTGCAGTVGEDRPEADVTLVLPGAPSAVDAGIATAVERGFDGAEGVHLRVRPPRAADPDAGARALADGRADFAVLPAAALRSRPALVGVMAITSSGAGAGQRPALVLSTTRRALEERPSVARATVRALLRGYDMALTDPASSVSDLQALFPALPRAHLDAQLDRLGGAIFPPGRQMGALPDGPQYEPGIVTAAASATRNP